MSQRLSGKVAVVTGAAGGVGAACAEALAAHGARVVVADIVVAGAADVAQRIVDAGGEAIAVEVDVSDEGQVAAMMTRAVDEFGALDVLHNNAAILRRDVHERDTAVVDLETEVWDLTMTVNLRGYMLGCKHAIPHMQRAGGGSIINTSSRSGSAGDLRLTSYGVSKGAINTLTKYVATQYGKDRVRCNAITLAAVMTETRLAHLDPRSTPDVARHLCLPEAATPADVGNVAVFLASDESRFITGHVLAVDGGWGAHMPTFAEAMDARRTEQ